jgi:hypothetical protein
MTYEKLLIFSPLVAPSLVEFDEILPVLAFAGISIILKLLHQ